MSNIDSMYAAAEFIEANLRQTIRVADMAESVSYSLYHFCRTFNAIVQHTPYDYLMRRRLTESARELVASDRKIIDIACDYGFNNPETYSRAFRRMFAMQPSQWRKRALTEEQRLMPRLSLAYLAHINRGNYLKPVLVEKEAFQLAGLMTLVEGDRAVTEKLWEILLQELERLGIKPEKLSEKREICHSERLEGAKNLVPDETGGDSSVATLPQNDINGSFQLPIENYYGVIWYPEDWERNRYFYLAGIEVPGTDISSSALVVKSLPHSKYARFIHKGPSKDLPYTLDYIYHTWLPKSGEPLAYPFVLETYRGAFGDWDQEEAEKGIYIPIE